MKNREIKFRGFHYGQWVYGNYIYDPRFDQHNIINYPDARKVQHHPVDPDTVGQYTGLKDKNGKEVFEGDVVIAAFMHHGEPSDLRFNAVIIYNHHVGHYQILYPNMDGDFVSDQIYFRYQIEVIGNVHDNSELLTPSREKNREG